MSTLDEVGEAAGRHGLTVHRAWPRSPLHLLLDLLDDDGRSVAGQWLAEDGLAARTAADTGPPARAEGRVVLQPGGADRRLPGLAAVLAGPGAYLVAHRPERRAVVRRGDGDYTKVVRPARTQQVACAARGAAVPGLRVPAVLAVDARAGTVVTRALPGRTLHALLLEGSAQAVQAAAALGAALAMLHGSAPVPGATTHDADDEGAVLARWEELARVHTGSTPPIGPVPNLSGRSEALVTVHRDLHDKQVLVDADGTVGLLDFDLAAKGEAALDLANLLVHLELRVEQGLASPGTAAAAAAAVLDAYRPDDDVLARLPVYRLATARRLAAVYAFRPVHASAARRVVERVLA